MLLLMATSQLKDWMKRGSTGSYSVITDNSSNWNTAFGWGNHATVGYIADSDFGSNGLYEAHWRWNLQLMVTLIFLILLVKTWVT